jgi:hypothetical protein
MATYRTGNHWGVTIVATQAIHGLTGDGLPTLREEDQLVAVVVNGDHALAERICGLLNGRNDLQAAQDVLVANRNLWQRRALDAGWTA